MNASLGPAVLAALLPTIAGLTVSVSPSEAGALTQPELQGDASDFDGRPIQRIDVVENRPVGEAPLDAQTERLARNQLRSAVGAPFRAEAVTEDLRRLNRTGRFDELSTEVLLVEGGGVVVRYLVTLRPIILDVQVVGNRSIGGGDIAEVIELPAGVPVDRFELDRAARRIKALYEERGFYRAQVGWDEEELLETGIVLFRVEEGQRIRVTDVRFEGAEAFEPKMLKTEVRTARVGILERGRLEPEVLEQDRAALIRFYRDRGHLDVRAGYTITESPNGREAIVTFVIDEGPVYTLRRVTVNYRDTDLGVFSADQAAGLMEIRSGDVYSINLLNRSIEAIESAHHQLGYVDARVISVERRDPDRPMVDLELAIQQGRRAMTGEIIVRGNEITRQNVIRRQVKVRPDRPLDGTQVERSERLLRATRLFQPTGTAAPSITIQRPDTEDPLYRDVLVEIQETNTGSFRFGAQVDSDNGLIGTISLNERNFDIRDTPDSFGEFISGRAFRGAGQTFNINVLPGTEVQTYSVGIADPALADSEYSGGVSLSYNRRLFNEHDRDTLGGTFRVGRTFGELWTGQLAYRLQRVELFNIDDDAPTDFFEDAGPDLIDGLGITLTRSTLNDNFRPTGGTRTQLRAEQVGLLTTDYDFTILGAQHVAYLTVHEDFLGRRTVLKASGEVNYIPQGAEDVPVYERFTRGGRDFRGFEFRTISPRGFRNDTGNPADDPIGGTWDFFLSLELEQPLFGDSLSGVVFLDTGTVINDPGFQDYRVAAGLGIRIAIAQLSPVPLAFDFAVPIVDEETDEDRLFTFSVDLPF